MSTHQTFQLLDIGKSDLYQSRFNFEKWSRFGNRTISEPKITFPAERRHISGGSQQLTFGFSGANIGMASAQLGGEVWKLG
jgi:hypothetical protein